MKKNTSCLLALAILLGASINLFAVDSVIVQTFTFDSIQTRQAKFQFPNANEKFSKVILKYRLKCDKMTQHDSYDCGEWDYHAYTKQLQPNPLTYTTKQTPKVTFGNWNATAETKKLLKNATTPNMDNYSIMQYANTAISATGGTKITLNAGEVVLKQFANHQFLLTGAEMTTAGMKTGDKVGRLVFDANLTEALNNVIIRYAKLAKSKTTQSGYYTDIWTDTIARLTEISPENCVDGKLTIPLNKDFVFNADNNYMFEIICDNNSSSPNSYLGKTANRKGVSAFSSNYAVLRGETSWIDLGDVPSIKGENGSSFTFEMWLNISDENSADNSNANIISIGNKMVMHLGAESEANKIYFEINNGIKTYRCRANTLLGYNQWNHIAVIFDKTGRINKERVRIVINGVESLIDFYDWNREVFPFITNTDATLAIGKGAYIDDSIISNLKASIANIRVWDEALTTTEIQENYMNIDINPTFAKYNNLLEHFTCAEKYAERTLHNSINNMKNGRVIGDVRFMSENQGAIFFEQTNIVPNITFIVADDFVYDDLSQEATIQKEQIPVSVVTFKTEELDEPVIDKIEYKYLPEIYTYDIQGNKIATIPVSGETSDITANGEMLSYQYKNNQTYSELEICRFITPYGIGLTLGPNGFEWEYDLTDFMHILRDDVILTTHNQQELVDLKFIFYKGEPTRNVVNFSEPWGPQVHSVAYKDLVNDKHFSASKTIELRPETKSVKLKTRITGHGMVDGGNGTQCCEFYDNTHYLSAGKDMDLVGEWHLWRTCADNPVFPQGGTWNIWREGWCPGDVVNEYDWELTQYMSDGTLKMDYDISPAAYYAAPPLGDGYYTMAMQLVEYGASRYVRDIELCKVITPSQSDLYRRVNPICNGITFVVRNNTDSPMNTFNVTAQVAGEIRSKQINFEKPLQPFTFDTLTWFIDSDIDNFWYAASQMQNPKIAISISNPDGATDDNLDNNEIISPLTLPDIYDKDNFTIKYKTNLRPQSFKLWIIDSYGDTIKTLNAPQANTEYKYDLKDLPKGCYTILLQDQGVDGQYLGLSVWFYTQQGSGSFGIYNGDGTQVLKSFNPDFGREIRYSVVLGGFNSVQESPELLLSLYPNPAQDAIRIKAYEDLSGAAIDVFDSNGNIVLHTNLDLTAQQEFTIDASKLAVGAYSIRVQKNDRLIWGKFVKK